MNLPYRGLLRRGRTLALSGLLGLLLGACTGGQQTQTSPFQRAGSSSSDESVFAIWPEDTAQQAATAAQRLASGEDPWRADPAQTATEFARAVLGWEDVSTDPVRDRMRCATCLSVHRRTSAAGVIVELRRLVAGKWWSVTRVGSEEADEYGLGISVHGSKVEMGFDRREASSVSVTVGYGGRNVTKAVTGKDEVKFDLGFIPDTPGHFLVLFLDKQGQVFDAAGTALPAGDFAAG